jgi:hypothetical protein
MATLAHSEMLEDKFAILALLRRLKWSINTCPTGIPSELTIPLSG